MKTVLAEIDVSLSPSSSSAPSVGVSSPNRVNDAEELLAVLLLAPLRATEILIFRLTVSVGSSGFVALNVA